MTSINETGGKAKQTREEWLAGLKTGDMVYCVGPYNIGNPQTPHPCKVTPKQINANRSNYSRSGLQSEGYKIIPATQEALEEHWRWVRHRKLVESVKYEITMDLTADQLRRIEVICKEGAE